MASIKCTECGAVLKTKAPVAPGKKVKCPKCSEFFAVKDNDDEAQEEPAVSDDDSQSRKASKRDDEPTKKSAGKKSKSGGVTAKQNSKTGLVIAIAGVAAVLLCCVPGVVLGVIWYGANKGANAIKDAVIKDLASRDLGPNESGAKNSKDGAREFTGKPDFVVTSETLSKEANDGPLAELKYKGKVVEVTGPVDNVSKSTVFALKGKGELDFVVCRAKVDHAKKISRLCEGQKVKVVAHFGSVTLGNVMLDVISVDELEPSRIAVRSAQELAKEFEKDENAALDKYDPIKGPKEGIIITGTVKDFTMPKGVPELKLIGTQALTVVITGGPDAFGQLKSNDLVQVRGLFSLYDDKSRQIKFQGGFLVPAK